MELQEEKLSRAISAYSRRQILRLLAEKELTVKDISNQTKMSVSLTSRHLTLLHDLGFLSVRKQYPNKFYSLRIQGITLLLEMYDKVLKKI
ncbi:transcriptional regulator [Candidatus Woesearchaeota archaeon CG10_big_fil_rev_8_21_14_0_10_36_11]|nr:MAG: transcriptional regulator [Candidatus Woesearchaeota archaeon CG10_big_fil_rev_8_21_14_0_10_36_11]